MGRAPRLRGEYPRRKRRGRSRHQGCGAGDSRAVCLRISAARDWRASPCSYLAVRRQRAQAYEFRVGVRLSGGERRDQHRDPRGGSESRCLSRVRCGRTAREQDELRGAHHAHPDGDRRCVAAGALAVQEQIDGDEDAQEKLYQAEIERRDAHKAALDATKSDVSFGSQIRSYVFQPYTMVNDHRTELKIPDVQKVMDGGIDPFIEAYLKQGGGSTTAAA